MSDIRWTVEQQVAIDVRGSLLVAAAAGSGKTAVLVERIIRRLLDLEDPVDVDRLLVVTFTKAAANEMKERIRKGLENALIKESDPVVTEHLLHQLSLLPRANITTLHSFCLDLLREYFYYLELDPAFRVADEVEAELLRQDSLDELFETKYEAEDPGFDQLVEALGSDRDDSPLGRQILRLYEMAYSQPEPDHWLQDLPNAYSWDKVEDLAASEWGTAVRQGVADRVHAGLNCLNRAIVKAQEPGGPGHYLPVLESEQAQVKLLLETLHTGLWSEVEEQFQALAFKTLPSRRLAKGSDELGFGLEQAEALKHDVQELRNQAKRSLAGVQNEIFTWSLAEQVPNLQEMSKMVKDLAALVVEFAECYRRNKRLRNVVDFTDFEHLALDLLEAKEESGSISLNLQARFAEVLVDEYQDINLVQERILQQVSRSADSAANLFMVGDVKQSIYRFRLADPTLFLDKYARFTKWSPPGDQLITNTGVTEVAVDLARNYRSRREVVDGVNFLFRQIMTEGAGEIRYDDRAALQYGASYVSGQEGLVTAEGPIEVHLFDKSLTRSRGEDPQDGGNNKEDERVEENSQEEVEIEENDLEEIELARVEARLVAQRIKDMVGDSAQRKSEFNIYDSALASFRSVQYSDIVVLMRSYSSLASVYQEEFQRAGIPVYAETSKGYFAANEVEIVLSLLSVIDNPRLDIPLAGVLRSPIVGLTGTELGKLRAILPQGDFYEACVLAVWAALDQGEILLNEPMPDFGREDVSAQDRKVESGHGQMMNIGEGSWRADDLPWQLRVDIQQVLKGYQASWAPLWLEAREVIVSTPALGAKITSFWLKLHKWRDFACHNSLADLIWLIYRDSGYYAYVGLLPGGVQRQANLRVLHDRACRFEATHYRGLFRFLRFMEKFRGQGKDMGNARTLGEKENVVRLQTVHASKGLEFPVVFVVGLGRAFNTRSLTDQVLLHPKLGIGLPVYDLKNRVRYPSFIRYAIKQQLAKEGMAEELRILYVALTRAKERLLLFGGCQELGKALAKWKVNGSIPGLALPDEQLRTAKCYLDWIGPALARHPLRFFGEDMELAEDKFLAGNSQWKVVLHQTLPWEGEPEVEEERDGASLEQSVQLPGESGDLQVWDDPELWYKEIDQRLSWIYPHQDSLKLAAKTSVSELKSRFADYTVGHITEVGGGHSKSWTRPKFLQPQVELSAAQRGVVFHTVMQHLPLQEWRRDWNLSSSGMQEEAVNRLLESLVEREILSSQQIGVIRPAQIVRLLNSSVGARLLNTVTVYREIPFTLALNSAGTEEEMLVQGVIDALIVNDDHSGIELIDYKTDYVGPDDSEPFELFKKRYSMQMAIYTMAAERLLKLKVERCIIYSLALGQEIELDKSTLTSEMAKLKEFKHSFSLSLEQWGK